MNGCKTLNLGTVTDVGAWEPVKERVEKYFIVLSVKCYDANINGCKTLNFVRVTDGGV